VLVTGEPEAEFIRSKLTAPDQPIDHADSIAELELALPAPDPSAVLLAFCSAVIVPPAILGRLAVPGYNIHPGPPNHPGRHPESWGAYHGETLFGATLHEMAPRVDEGAIVDVQWTAIPPGAGQLDFGRFALRSALGLLVRWLPRILGGELPLPHGGQRWSGRKTSHAEFEAMRRVTRSMDPVEVERRRRAFGQAAGLPLVILERDEEEAG
jgi:methionyl-tRNA formyltransferase